MTANPYQAPKARVDDQPVPVDALPLAGKGRRFANLLLDNIFFYLCAVLLGVVLGIAGMAESLRHLGRLGEALVGWSLLIVYYAVQEGLWGVTLGKLITGTRVIGEDGAAPRFKQILGRTLARLVPFEPFSFLGREPTGWHDRWSATKVVRVRLPR